MEAIAVGDSGDGEGEGGTKVDRFPCSNTHPPTHHFRLDLFGVLGEVVVCNPLPAACGLVLCLLDSNCSRSHRLSRVLSSTGVEYPSNKVRSSEDSPSGARALEEARLSLTCPSTLPLPRAVLKALASEGSPPTFAVAKAGSFLLRRFKLSTFFSLPVSPERLPCFALTLFSAVLVTCTPRCRTANGLRALIIDPFFSSALLTRSKQFFSSCWGQPDILISVSAGAVSRHVSGLSHISFTFPSSML